MLARPPCWIAVCTHTLNSHRLTTACCAWQETNFHDCTDSGCVSDGGCDSRAHFPERNTMNARWGTTPCVWPRLLVYVKTLHILRGRSSHTLQAARARLSTAPCLDTRENATKCWFNAGLKEHERKAEWERMLPVYDAFTDLVLQVGAASAGRQLRATPPSPFSPLQMGPVCTVCSVTLVSAVVKPCLNETDLQTGSSPPHLCSSPAPQPVCIWNLYLEHIPQNSSLIIARQ